MYIDSILSDDEIGRRLAEFHSFGDIEILEKTSEYHRFLDKMSNCIYTMRYLHSIALEEIFDFSYISNFKINKHLLFQILVDYVPRSHFITIDKIYILEDIQDFEHLKKKYNGLDFEFERHFGYRYVLEQGEIVVINLGLIKKRTDFEYRKINGSLLNSQSRLSILFLEVLLHELKHCINNCVIIQEDEIPLEEDEEDFVKEYGKNLSEKIFNSIDIKELIY